MSLNETKSRTKKVVATCQICADSLNRSSRLPIKCPYCSYECCRTCCETYALNESAVKCMSPDCSHEWSRKDIREIFTLVFINGPLKEHREKTLFDSERALLPATQPIIEGKIQAKKIDGQITGLTRQIAELNRQIAELQVEKSHALNRRRTNDRAAFIRACPEDGCRGFLSTQWKCGICEKWVCPDCNAVKGYTRDAEHTCNEDDLATAQLIATDTKPCPKCATGIFKIDGCDQMWCTQCHTAFSWRTGRIEQNVHNPHFFEWQRRNGGNVQRNPNDVPCGRNLDHYLYSSFTTLMKTHYYAASNARMVVSRIDRLIRSGIHMMHVERPPQVDYAARNESLRVQYLMKEITEEQMREQLQRDDKKHAKNQELRDVFTLVTNTLTDILYRFYDDLNTNKLQYCAVIDSTMLNEVDTIVAYANECLSDISHTYSCSQIIIDEKLQVLRGKNAQKYLQEGPGKA